MRRWITGLACAMLVLVGAGCSERSAPAHESARLPFDLPAQQVMEGSRRLVLAHYFTGFPLSIDNRPPSVDYYARNYLTVGGEDGKHAAYGGLLRDRPIPVPPGSGDWELANFRREVRQARSAGLDGFTVDLLSLDGYHRERVEKLMRAAHQVDGDFKILLMPDMTTLDDKSEDELATGVAQLAKFGSAMRLRDNRLVVSPFKSEAKSVAWWRDWLALMRQRHGIDVAFVPAFLNWQLRDPEFDEISYGISRWASRNPRAYGPEPPPPTGHTYGKLWMNSVAVQDVRPSQAIYSEASNAETLMATWKTAIDQNTDWVQMVTWNDYSESTAFAPSVQHGWVPLDLSAYYIVRLKTGKWPRITRDAVYLIHRTQFVAAEPTGPQTETMSLREGTGEPRDDVEVVTFLTEPATVQVHVGRRVHQMRAPAGLHTARVPLDVGQISAEVTRGEKTVARVESPYTVQRNPEVQDLQYHFSSSLRQARAP